MRERPRQAPHHHTPRPTNWLGIVWLGPAPERPYNTLLYPRAMRGWRAFGSGIVGDFGCHTGNLMFRALPP